MGERCRFYIYLKALHDGVTGSCNLVIVKFPNGENLRFIVDCGLFYEKQYEQLNSKLNFDSKEIEFCLVTHAHVDHIGRIPLLVKRGFNKKIYATKATCKLMKPALEDSFKVLNSESQIKKTKCLYSASNVYETLKLLEGYDFNTTKNIHKNVKVTFLKNGHLVGAALILVQISYPGYNDINLLFTGDYKNENVFFDVDSIPKWIRNLPLTIVSEATYGKVEEGEVKKVFEDNIVSYTKKGASIIIPTFSLERAQKILYKLKLMQEMSKIKTEIPIYLDGKLSIHYTEMFKNEELGIKEEMKDFIPQNLHYVNKNSRNTILKSRVQKIVLTSSGMASHGPAQLYISEYLPKKNTLIQFVGYTAEGTLGRQLKDAEKGELIQTSTFIRTKIADVEYTEEESGHAKANELIDLLKVFTNLKLVLIEHGEPETKIKYKNMLEKDLKPKDTGILNREVSYMINSYGLVKKIQDKI